MALGVEMRILGLHPDVAVLAGNTRLFFSMMDLFKGLGHKVTIVGRHRRETRAKVKVMTPFGPQILSVKEGMFKKHYDIEDFNKYHPVKHLTTKDIMLEGIPVSHPFMYFPQRVKRLLWKADVAFTDIEIFVRLPEKVQGIEKKMIQYIHFPLESLKPVAGHPPKAIWCNSKFTKQHIKDFWGLHAEIVNPPIYCDFYRNNNGFNDREYDVVMFSRLHPDKFTVLNSLNDFHVAVIGSNYGFKPPSWVDVYENATFKQVVNILSRSKVSIHAKGFGEYEGGRKSEAEHFGQTIIEAMASGCVPIVPNAGGPVEIVGSNEEHGYLFSSIDELKAKIKRLLEDKELWTDRSKTAVKRANDFDVKVIAEQVKKLLEKLEKKLASQ